MSVHKCPACGTATEPIATGPTPKNIAEGLPPGASPYYAPDVKQDFWTGGYPALGYMRTELCPSCDLVSWFAHRHKDSLPRPAAGPEADLSGLPVPAASEHPQR